MGRKPEWWKDPVLVTILVAIVTAGWVVSSRIASLESSLIERIGDHDTAAADRFGAVEARLAAFEARMDLLLDGLDITVTARKSERAGATSSP